MFLFAELHDSLSTELTGPLYFFLRTGVHIFTLFTYSFFFFFFTITLHSLLFHVYAKETKKKTHKCPVDDTCQTGSMFPPRCLG